MKKEFPIFQFTILDSLNQYVKFYTLTEKN